MVLHLVAVAETSINNSAITQGTDVGDVNYRPSHQLLPGGVRSGFIISHLPLLCQGLAGQS